MKKDKIDRKLLNTIARVSSQGLILVILSFLGLYAGIYLDGIFNMAPNMTFLFLMVGISIGFFGFVRESKKL